MGATVVPVFPDPSIDEAIVNAGVVRRRFQGSLLRLQAPSNRLLAAGCRHFFGPSLACCHVEFRLRTREPCRRGRVDWTEPNVDCGSTLAGHVRVENGSVRLCAFVDLHVLLSGLSDSGRKRKKRQGKAQCVARDHRSHRRRVIYVALLRGATPLKQNRRCRCAAPIRTHDTRSSSRDRFLGFRDNAFRAATCARSPRYRVCRRLRCCPRRRPTRIQSDRSFCLPTQ
jgi:hypothetical protein